MIAEEQIQPERIRGKRIVLLDLWRGLALLFMIGHHVCYDMVYFSFQDGAFLQILPVKILHYLSAYPFIFLAGISSCFSRSNLWRGCRIFYYGLLVSLVTSLIGNAIRFGILHFLGVAMILYGLFGERLREIPDWLAPTLWLVLFIATKYWTSHTVIQIQWLWVFGFRYPEFYSSDYFPLLPWIFLFLLGTWFGGVLQRHRTHPLLNLSCPRWLLWPGQHTLIIYLVHQPLLYGIFWFVGC